VEAPPIADGPQAAATAEVPPRPRLGKGRRRTILGVLLVALVGTLVVAVAPMPTTGESCSTAERDDYSLQLCILSPTDGMVLKGGASVEVSVEPLGDFPGIQRMVFYLDEGYLLTDYEAPYHFVLPSQSFPDGQVAISAEALLRDEFVTERLTVAATIENGQASSEPLVPFRPSQGTSPPAATPFVIAAVGDGASGRVSAAQVVDVIGSMAPNLVYYLGDVYERGSYTEFLNWYGQSGELWDRFRSITNPVIGNHERLTDAASGFVDYWGEPPLDYRVDVAGWTLIALDVQAGPLGDAQTAWLTEELAASAACTAVFQHHPVLSLGPHGDHTAADDMWRLYAGAGVDVVVAGHDHNYQRWIPLDSTFEPSGGGPVQMVVGTGGHGVRPTTASDNRVAAVFDAAPAAHGALRMDLNPAGLVMTYLDVHGEVLDWTALACSGASRDTTAPTSPRNPSGMAPDGNRVDLEWGPGQDDTAVSGYVVERDGVEVAALDGSRRSYTDLTVQPNTLYAYVVRAVDLAGNRSTPSQEIFVPTGDPPSVLVFDAVADTYVNPEESSTNYGTAPRLRVDGDPAVTTYLRFEVPELAGPVVKATLRLRAESALGVGYVVSVTEDGLAWSDDDLTFDTAPPLGTQVGIAPASGPDTWVEIDVTAGVMSAGDYTFALAGMSSTNHRISSRESAHGPELIVEIDVGA